MSGVVKMVTVGAGSICSVIGHVKLVLYRKLTRKNIVERLRAAGM